MTFLLDETRRKYRYNEELNHQYPMPRFLMASQIRIVYNSWHVSKQLLLLFQSTSRTEDLKIAKKASDIPRYIVCVEAIIILFVELIPLFLHALKLLNSKTKQTLHSIWCETASLEWNRISPLKYARVYRKPLNVKYNKSDAYQTFNSILHIREHIVVWVRYYFSMSSAVES